MDTREIVLEEVMKGTYDELKKFWRKHKLYPKIEIGCRVHNPIKVETTVNKPESAYENLFLMCLDHPQMYQISVIIPGGKWLRTRKYHDGDVISDEKISELARIASRDRIKDKFLEILFKKDPERVNDHLSYLDLAIMEFREYDKLIIGYQIVVPARLEDLFDMNIESKYKITRGIWVPDNYD